MIFDHEFFINSIQIYYYKYIYIYTYVLNIILRNTRYAFSSIIATFHSSLACITHNSLILKVALVD